MSSIIATLGGVALLCGAGFCVSTSLRLFHEFEMQLGRRLERKESLGPMSPRGGAMHRDKLDNLRKNVRQQG